MTVRALFGWICGQPRLAVALWAALAEYLVIVLAEYLIGPSGPGWWQYVLVPAFVSLGGAVDVYARMRSRRG